MCRQKESKAGRGKRKVTSVLPHTAAATTRLFFRFFPPLCLIPVPLTLLLAFRCSSLSFFFSFLSLAILTSEARKEIRVAPWHRLSVHFTRFAVGAITYEFPLSSRFLLFPLSLASFSRSFRYRSTVQLKTVHSFRALSSNSVGRSSLGSSSAGSFAFS